MQCIYTRIPVCQTCLYLLKPKKPLNLRPCVFWTLQPWLWTETSYLLAVRHFTFFHSEVSCCSLQARDMHRSSCHQVSLPLLNCRLQRSSWCRIICSVVSTECKVFGYVVVLVKASKTRVLVTPRDSDVDHFAVVFPEALVNSIRWNGLTSRELVIYRNDYIISLIFESLSFELTMTMADNFCEKWRFMTRWQSFSPCYLQRNRMPHQAGEVLFP